MISTTVPFKIHDENEKFSIHQSKSSLGKNFDNQKNTKTIGLGGFMGSTPINDTIKKSNSTNKTRRAFVDLSNTQRNSSIIDHSISKAKPKPFENNNKSKMGFTRTEKKKTDCTPTVNIFQEQTFNKDKSELRDDISEMLCLGLKSKDVDLYDAVQAHAMKSNITINPNSVMFRDDAAAAAFKVDFYSDTEGFQFDLPHEEFEFEDVGMKALDRDNNFSCSSSYLHQTANHVILPSFELDDILL